MKVIVVIQARMGSSRLPGKVLRKLGDKEVLAYNVARCQNIIGIDNVIVATSTLEQDDAIVAWCREHHINCFRGSEDDVLDRYAQCARKYEPDYVMRVTSDCPFVDYEMASEIIEKMKTTPCDYVKIQGELPRGLAVELFSYQALQYIHLHGNEPRHREHVTYYGYEFPNEFRFTEYEAPKEKCHPSLRITLDTKEDYQLCQVVAKHFSDMHVSSNDVIQYLLCHPEIADINAHIEQKQVK